MRLAVARPDLVGALVLTRGAARPRARAGLAAPRRPTGRCGPCTGPVWSSDARMERARRRHGSADYRAAQGVMRDVLVRLVNERYDDALSALALPGRARVG